MQSRTMLVEAQRPEAGKHDHRTCADCSKRTDVGGAAPPASYQTYPPQLPGHDRLLTPDCDHEPCYSSYNLASMLDYLAETSPNL